MPMPWEKDWGAAQTSAPIHVKKEDKGGILPWLRDWASEQLGNSPKTTQKRSTIDERDGGNTNTLDTVFKGLIQAESGSKHLDSSGKLISSKKGARGITQLMPSTAKNPGFGIEPVKDDSEAEYLRVGKEYLSALYNKYNNWEQALAAYNAGTGNVDKAVGKANRFGGVWKDYLPVKEETIPYINKILGKRSALDTPKEKFYPGTSIEQGIKNVKSMAYDIASIAPVTGEMISAKDLYSALKEGDMTGMAIAGIGMLPGVGMVKRAGIGERFFKTPFDVKNGYVSVLNNPIHLKDGTRLSGFTDANQTTMHGYDKNGERFTLRVDKINPEDIVYSKDGNKTAEYFKKQLTPDNTRLQDSPSLEELAKENPDKFLSILRPVQQYVGDVENAQIFTLKHGSKSTEKFTHVTAKTSKDGALGPGFYLTESDEAAKSYGGNVREVVVGYKRPLEITYTGKDDVVEQIAGNEDFWKTNFLTKGQARKWARQQKEDFAGIGDEDFLEMLKDAGFDGVIMRDEKGKIVEATAVNRNQFRFVDVED